jgi:mannosyl-oligosaccharide alpha-1,2-mannosidase
MHVIVTIMILVVVLSNVACLYFTIPANAVRAITPPSRPNPTRSTIPQTPQHTPQAVYSLLYDRPLPVLTPDESKASAVKDAFIFAWDSYKKYAWGYDFLRPLSRSGNNVFSGGLSITDSLDTLILMGLDKEYELAKKWIEDHFQLNGRYSVFEIIIRHLGSFLSAYQLKGDPLFLEKALEVGEALLPVFKSSTGYFQTFVSFDGNKPYKAIPDGAREVLLSDIGSIQLEFYTLSMLSGDMRFAKKAAKIHQFLFDKHPYSGLYPERMYFDTGEMERQVFSIDAMSDSFYEYLIKIWLMTNYSLPVMLERYLMATDEIEQKLVTRMKKTNWTYTIVLRNGVVERRMTHLATFAAGMLAIGSVTDNPRAIEHLELADELVSTYVALYSKHKSGLMPECMEFYDDRVRICAGEYLLRPETIESIFVMYRFTGLQKYRDYAWTIFQAIEKSCKVKDGYAGVNQVDEDPLSHADHMDSYFLAETLKYLYLIFSGSDLIPMASWVFNTEAHPLRMWSGKAAATFGSEIEAIIGHAKAKKREN